MLQDAAQRLRSWAVQHALPLWDRVGVDRARGGFHEQINFSGEPDTTAPRRTRVQARQIYVYSHAAALGWYPEGTELGLRGLEFLRSRCRPQDGSPGYVQLLAPDNSIANGTRDTYDHAFILLALAWLARASGDAQVHGLLHELLGFVDERLAVGDGTLHESIPPGLPRRQNPHMHMFEAMLALHEATRQGTALARAAELAELLPKLFFDEQSDSLGEYFTEDWRPWPDNLTREPGHHAEWTWLLRRHERFTGKAPGELPSRLLARALSSAEPVTGFLIDEVDPSGAPRATTRRLWPQTELAKAWLAEAETGRAGAAGAAARVLEALHAHYLSTPIPGCWIDKFDSDGRPLASVIPASTLYHLFCAIAEADRVASLPESSPVTKTAASEQEPPHAAAPT